MACMSFQEMDFVILAGVYPDSATRDFTLLISSSIREKSSSLAITPYLLRNSLSGIDLSVRTVSKKAIFVTCVHARFTGSKKYQRVWSIRRLFCRTNSLGPSVRDLSDPIILSPSNIFSIWPEEFLTKSSFIVTLFPILFVRISPQLSVRCVADNVESASNQTVAQVVVYFTRMAPPKSESVMASSRNFSVRTLRFFSIPSTSLFPFSIVSQSRTAFVEYNSCLCMSNNRNIPSL